MSRNSENAAALNARLAECKAELEHLQREWDYLVSETVTLHDQCRHAHGTGKLLGTYLSETIAVMRSIGYAQDSAVLKNLFNDLVSRLSHQHEACERSVAGLRATLESLEQWNGKVKE